jgi:trehalose 6-phosphate synthase
LLRAAAVGVVTPLRDGMNLVAKEFVAAQSSVDPGALVLSAHAGAARELDGALQVDPQDPDSVATAIGQALRMSRAERRERHGAMLRTLLANDASAWSQRLVSRLAAARHA